MARLRAALLVAIFVLFTLPLMPVQWLLLKLRSPAARTFPNWYHRHVAALFGIHITVIGKPVTGEGVLLVGNHTSWADIIIFSAVTPLSFVAKAEVAQWPFFGTLARLQRTVFVERHRRSATGETRDQIRERLLAGDALLLFPEGTSHDGNAVLPFKSALLGAAEAELNGHHVKVQPVSTAYTGRPMACRWGGKDRPFFAWYGDMETGAASVGSAAEDRPARCGGPVSPRPSAWMRNGPQGSLARNGRHALVRSGQAQALAGLV